MQPPEEHLTLYAATTDEWRNWLSDNCLTEKIVWLIIYHKKSNIPGVQWNDAIENALCFGWVDSVALKRDSESCFLKFTPRNPKSNWSKRNKERAQKMIQNGSMTDHGNKLIETAKLNNKW